MQANPPCSSSTYFLFSLVLTPPHFLSLVLTPSHCFCSLPALPVYWSAWSQHRLTSYAASLPRIALSRNMSGGKFRTIFLCLGRSGSEKKVGTFLCVPNSCEPCVRQRSRSLAAQWKGQVIAMPIRWLGTPVCASGPAGVSIRKPRKAYDGPGRSIAGREEHFSERWIRGVDQGWIRVDQGWISHMSSCLTSAKP